jgi:hypothetical protein
MENYYPAHVDRMLDSFISLSQDLKNAEKLDS